MLQIYIEKLLKNIYSFIEKINLIGLFFQYLINSTKTVFVPLGYEKFYGVFGGKK